MAGRYLAHSAVVAVAAGMEASGARRADEIGVEEEEVEVEGALRAVGGRDPEEEDEEKDGTDASAAEVAAAAAAAADCSS